MTLFLSELSQNGTTVLLDIKDSIKYTLPSKIHEGLFLSFQRQPVFKGVFESFTQLIHSQTNSFRNNTVCCLVMCDGSVAALLE